jgi:hypothetical protein
MAATNYSAAATVDTSVAAESQGFCMTKQAGGHD